MSWTRHFKPVNSVMPVSPTSGSGNSNSMSSFSSWLPEVYIGPANRLQRYTQYEHMDFDHEVHSALDIIAEFSTQTDPETNLPFQFKFAEQPSGNELNILKKLVKQWCDLNQLQKRVFKIFRSVLKYGDQFFIRDPETYKLYWVDPATVEKVVVNESTGKEIETYFIKDLDTNIANLVASEMQRKTNSGYGSADGFFPLAPAMGQSNYISSSSSQANQSGSAATSSPAAEVDAKNVVHISLTEGMDDAWPFGVSELEKIYKVYKQKELLEESLIIYRVHRAPERRVFKIDVGSMSPARAAQYLERVKNDVQQRRIPSKNGGCFAMDTKVPLLDGRVLTIAELATEYQAGKENWAYSCDPVSGAMVPGLITWAGVTQESAQVIKLTLDNGEEIICTPEHKFPILGKGKTEAKDIVVGEDSLFALNRRLHPIELKNRAAEFQQIFNNSTKDWEFTHRVASIEYVNSPMQVGTLTIDGSEKYHNYHTFAIEQGVYTFNSNIMDATYSPMSMLEDYYFSVSSDGRGSSVDVLAGGENLGCFALNTKIKLLDGRDLSIKDIATELAAGEKLWTYSCHPITGAVVPGPITWAGKTRSDAEVLRLVLDNGEDIICTPDHKFPILGLGFVKAEDLYEGQSLIPLYTKNEKISENTIRDYEQVFDNESREWIYTHRLVLDFLKIKGQYPEFVYNESRGNEPKTVRHHVDHNRFNNSPENLVWMSFFDHKDYHADHGFSVEAQALGTKTAKEKMAYLKEHKPDEYNAIIQKQVAGRKAWFDSLSAKERADHGKKISNGILDYIASLTDEEMHIRNDISKANFLKGTEKFLEMLKQDPEFKEFVSLQIKNGQAKSKLENPELWATRSEKITKSNFERWELEDYYDKVFTAQKLKFDIRLFELLTKMYISHKPRHRFVFCELLTNNNEFMNHFKQINTVVHSNANLDQFSVDVLEKMLAAFNLTWESFKLTHTPVVNDDLMKYFVGLYEEGMSQEKYVRVLREVSKYGHIRYLMQELKTRGIENFAMFKTFAKHKNHRVVRIEKLTDTMDVGTLTIDETESIHDYHTYALSAGVFVKNSMDDVKYWHNKMLRALGVPSSYLPSGPEDGTFIYNDGRVGTAFIQEFRFQQSCLRLQRQIIEILDKEFKAYIKAKGFTIDDNLYTLAFTEPQSFSEYREIEINTARIQAFTQISTVPYVSKRFALKKYLGWTDEDVVENETMWKEEKGELEINSRTTNATMRDTGFGMGDFEEFGNEGDLDLPDETTGDLSDDLGDMGGDDLGAAGAAPEGGA